MLSRQAGDAEGRGVFCIYLAVIVLGPAAAHATCVYLCYHLYR